MLLDYCIASGLDAERNQLCNIKDAASGEIKSNHAKIAIAALDTTYEQMAAYVNNLEGETGRAGCNTF